MAALVGLAGLDPGIYLRARWPDDIAIIEAVALEAQAIRDHEAEDLARRTANAVGKMLDG